MAPTRAPKTTCVSTMPGWTIPLPTVAATLRWKTKTATTLKKAAKATACVGLSTPVETTVAIELAASWKPFMKSNSKASTTSRITTHRAACTDSITKRLRERSEEHTSELQSPCNLVCRLLLEKKKKEIT